MPPRQREEVLNTILARVIVARGLNASPETIRSGGREKPDVLISFRGLRCVIEGKLGDVSGARRIVLGDALGRIESGLSQIAVAVVYSKLLRDTPFVDLPNEMSAATYDFCICTEVGPGEWQSGAIDEILNALRRTHEILASDDTVRQAADELSVGLTEIANVFTDNAAVCDRLVDLLGIGSKEESSDDTD